MTYEEKRELRLQISQLLADAGLNQKAIKDMVEAEIKNKVDRAIEQTINSLNSENTETYPFRELKIEDVLKTTMYDKETGKEFMDFPITVVSENLNRRTSSCTFCPNNPSNGGSGICNCILGQPHIT